MRAARGGDLAVSRSRAAAARGSTSDRTCSGPALFEGANFDEWTGDTGGTAQAFPAPPNVIEISTERVHHGGYAAKLTIDAAARRRAREPVLARAGGRCPSRPTTAPGTTFRAASPSATTG